jgi:hypothetical protein
MDLKEESPLYGPIHQALDELDLLRLFLEALQPAVGGGMVRLMDAVRRSSKKSTVSDNEYEARRARAAEVETFATSRGSEYVSELGVVKLWSILEAAVDNLLVLYLSTPERWPATPALKRIEGPLVEFAAASPEERAEYLAEQLKADISAQLKAGIGRFEVIVAAIGLAGAVEPEIRRRCFELSNVRNVVVHKGGIADRRFVEACPWFGVAAGEKIRITELHFHRYAICAMWYLTEVAARLSSSDLVTPHDRSLRGEFDEIRETFRRQLEELAPRTEPLDQTGASTSEDDRT